ncbi:MAG: hypothetical protein J6V76_05580 [Bacteroidales bacterium]|nr:hypothetical protein [Bacteroidales bacterium]
MGLFSFLFGTAAPAQALGKPVPPESVPADDNYANTFRIAEAMLIAPSSVNVGMKQAKRYKNRCAAIGTIEKGSFKAGDTVIVKVNGKPVEVLAHDVIAAPDGESAEEKLVNRTWATPQPVNEGEKAWIYLELTVKADTGSIIGKN